MLRWVPVSSLLATLQALPTLQWCYKLYAIIILQEEASSFTISANLSIRCLRCMQGNVTTPRKHAIETHIAAAARAQEKSRAIRDGLA